MTCRELAELLADFIDNELPQENCQQIQEHLGDCPHCVHYVATYRLTIQLTRILPCCLPPSVEQRLREQLGRAT
jgi:anti-sigma factor RsiW